MGKMHGHLMIILCWTCSMLVATEASENDDMCLATSACDDPHRTCYCDPECQWFNDCCTNNRTDDTKIDMSSIPKLEYMSCIGLISGVNNHFWVVGQCPGNFEQCFLSGEDDSISNVLPVTDMKNNITFRNRRCAECHGISDFSYWRGSISQTSRENCVAVVDYLQNLTTIGNISIEGTADYLLSKGCSLVPYPPVGFSPRKCVPNLVEVSNCSSQFLPIRYIGENKAFRNRECCTQDIGNCSTPILVCVTRENDNNIWSYPFDLMRFHADVRSNSFLINFAQGLEQQTLPDEMQYVDIEFWKKFTLHFSVAVGQEHLEFLLCVLLTYFENMKDSFILESLEGEVLQNVNVPTRHTIVIHVNMVSHQFFRNTREISDLQTWLETMDMTYSMFETSDEENADPSLFSVTDVKLSPENTSTIGVHNIRVGSKIKSFINHIVRRNRLCGVFDKDPATPKTRCLRLEVKVMSAKERPIFQLVCSQSNPLEKQSSSTAPFVSASNMICMSLVVVLLSCY